MVKMSGVESNLPAVGENNQTQVLLGTNGEETTCLCLVTQVGTEKGGKTEL